MNHTQKILLSFDLDNTLINNREGIVNSFNYALNKYNLQTLDRDEIEAMIGIPLAEMFERVTIENSDKLITAFREYYSKTGIYQASLLPGVKEKLTELIQNSFTLGVITSKKQELAIKITKILGIFEQFIYILGESDSIKSKLDPRLKTHLLQKYHEYSIVIIGDHPKDKALAENINAPFVGVLTGNHSAKVLISGIKIKTLVIESVKDLEPEMIYNLM
ncbi:MAG: HAD family hydrolase [Candidatus Lokiarchaeota archaeon]|nr:HAD family hydrolase [Candidatus Lokiarchaeota archaeon]